MAVWDAPASVPSPTRTGVLSPAPLSATGPPATVQPVPMNCIPVVEIAPAELSTLTVPGLFWNTAKRPPQAWAAEPFASVQLVGPALQLPEPPWTVPSATVVVPFQNWVAGTGPGPEPTTRLT